MNCLSIGKLVDPESITVTLTQIGSSQDLIVDAIEWGRRIKIKSGNGTGIDCFYLVHAERADGEKLIVEYEGQSSDDYPGDVQFIAHQSIGDKRCPSRPNLFILLLTVIPQ